MKEYDGLERLETKIINIGGKYADLVEKQIERAVQKEGICREDILDINDGLRTLHQVTAALWKLGAYEHSTDAQGI